MSQRSISAYLFFYCAILLASAQIRADLACDPVMLSADTLSAPLGKSLQFYIDQTGQQQLESILQRPLPWRPSAQEVPSFGYDTRDFWFKGCLSNTDSRYSHWKLHIAYPLLDRLNIIIHRENGTTQQYRLGDNLPYDQRPVKHRDFVIPLDLDANETVHFAINIQTQGTAKLPLTIWRPDAFEAYNYEVQMLHGIYFGFMVVMVLYNFFIFLWVRDRSYLYYLGYVAGLGLVQFTFLGFSYQYLWPTSPWLQEKLMPVGICFTLVSICAFTLVFLDIKKYSRFGAGTLTAIISLAVLFAFLAFFLPYTLMTRLSILLVLIGSCTCFLLGLLTLIKRNPFALFYMLAWSTLLGGAFMLAMTGFNWLPSNVITINALEIGGAAEVVLLSLALAARIKYFREQQYRAEQEALQAAELARIERDIRISAQESENERLEQQVKHRTEALEHALSGLREANQKLEHISATDALTGIFNRRYFNQQYRDAYLQGIAQQHPISIMMLDIDHFKNINDTWGHQAGDAVLQEVAQIATERLGHHGIFARYGGEEFIAMLPNSKAATSATIAERIRRDIAATRILHEGYDIAATISIGVASIMPRDVRLSTGLIAQADLALYTAKENGRNQVSVATQTPVAASVANSPQ
ncbi:MAG: diguanylate cyclase [Pseudomonadales bacterium]|nr:diguanylate cyclase [Pseudomonadales bacterium]